MRSQRLKERAPTFNVSSPRADLKHEESSALTYGEEPGRKQYGTKHEQRKEKRVSNMHYIEPVRLLNITKRARVLARYCAIAEPTEHDLASHAAEVGVSPHRFYIMARAWKARPDVEHIGGATVKVDRVPKIPAVVLTILTEVMQELGPSALLSKIDALVRKRCADKSIEAPSPAAIHYRVMKLRSSQDLPQDLVGHVVFQCRPQIPVRSGGKIRSPWLTGAIELPSKRVTHPFVTIGEPEDVTGIIERLLDDHGGDVANSPIYVSATCHRRLPAHLLKIAEPAGKTLTGSVLLGRRLGNLTILHRAHPGMDAKLARRLEGTMNNALKPKGARELIFDAVAVHNRCRKDQ